MNITAVKLKDGRTYDAAREGLDNLRRTYLVIFDEIPGENDELTYNKLIIAGLPHIGSAHPFDAGLLVDKFHIKEGAGPAKATAEVEVEYKRVETTSDSTDPEDPEAPEIEGVVERWGWDAGTEQRELITAVDTQNTPVVNSAGDVFDTAPTIDTPAPTFTKVLRTKKRISGWPTFNCTINKEAMIIGEEEYPPLTLRCQICEERVLGETEYPFRYTITFKYRSNKAKVKNGESVDTIVKECGWNTVVTDAGMRQKDANGKLVLITTLDPRTQEPVNVTSPELLNGEGKAVSRSDSFTPNPFNLVFQSYASVSHPAWMYSEPPLPEDDDEEDNPPLTPDDVTEENNGNDNNGN